MNLRNERKTQELTQEELARKCHLSTSYVGKIERGEKIPSLVTVFALANQLDVSVPELLGSGEPGIENRS